MSRVRLTTEAVVLRAVPFRDADLIVTLYTLERGKVSAIARGARKSRRRFGAGLGLFAVSELELAGKARAEMWTIASCDLIRDFTRLGSDVGAMAHGSYGVELVRELTVPDQADAAVFDLLVELFEVLLERGPAAEVLRGFELHLLSHVGLAPRLDRCVACGDEPGSDVALDGVRGGLTCAACTSSPLPRATTPLSSAALALLIRAQRATSLAEMHPGAGATATPGGAQARDAMLAVLLAHIGKPLRSVEFIAKMSGAARKT